MQVYIHTFIAKREAFNLSPLQLTEPIHVRLFFSPHYITKEDYQQYMEWLNSADQCTEFHNLGAAPATLTKASLLPANAFATQVGAIKYDFMLEAQEDYLAYLEFVRQTLKLEVQRPVFRPQTKVTAESQAKQDLIPEHMITTNSKVVKQRQDVPHKDTELPTFLLVHPPLPIVYHELYFTWYKIAKEYVDRASFYRLEDPTITEPEILHPLGYCWIVCNSLQKVSECMTKKSHALYQLSTGHLVEEKQYGHFWVTLLGTDAMPLVKIDTELSLQGLLLIKKRGEDVLETQITEAQLGIIRPFFTNKEIRPFSVSALYDLFARPGKTKPVIDSKAATIHPGQFQIGINDTGTMMRDALGNLVGENTARAINARLMKENKANINAPVACNSFNTTDITDTTNTTNKAPDGLDAYACGWETIKETTVEKRPEADVLRKQVQELIREFKESYAPLQSPPLMTISPTLFQHGFLLYILHKQKSTRSQTTMDYSALIEYFKKTNMDLQEVVFSAANLTILYPLLDNNTDFLEYSTAPEGLSLLEARVLLSLYQYPLEYQNPQQQIQLFQLIVKEFAKTLKVSEEGRVAAKALWDSFLAFLRKHRLDYVGFFGTQQEFNEILKDLGWEQKRVAAGKVWLKMELTLTLA
jgi:hypothetical protein